MKKVMVQRSLEDWNILELVEPCPFCGKSHTHGGQREIDFNKGCGPRTPPCNRAETYWLEEARNERRLQIEQQLDNAKMEYIRMGSNDEHKKN